MKLALLALALLGAASATELTPDTWDSAVAGKTVFIKFLAPWWGHCKRMKPDWDKLMAEYKDSTTILVADVDCTAEGKPLCDGNGVRGFPTIKHGDPAALEDYQGGRDYDALSKFAKTLKPLCSPANIDLCDDEQKTLIEELMAKGADALGKDIEALEEKIEDAENNFKSEVEKLQKKYESLTKEKDDAIDAVKDQGLGLMKAVKAHVAMKAKEEL